MNHRVELQFKSIVPYDAAFSLNNLRNPRTLLMLFCVGPLVFNNITSNPEVQMLLVSGYFALAWAVYFYVKVARCATSLWLGLGAAVLMVSVGIPVGTFLHYKVLLVFYEMTMSPSASVRLLGNILSHGLNEELMKALPVLLLAFGLHRIKKPMDGIFFGALSGLGFAAWEGHKLILEAQTPAVMMMTVYIRSITLALLHAAWTGISGYFIALSVLRRQPVALSAIGIAIAIFVHGFFDFCAEGHQSFVVAAFTYLLFTGYVYRTEQMTDRSEDDRETHLQAAQVANE